MKQEKRIPIILPNIVISLFITAITPYNFENLVWYKSFLYWFLAIHSGYVLNHLGIIGFSELFKKAFVAEAFDRTQLLIVFAVSAVIAAFPLSAILVLLNLSLTPWELSWSYLYFQTLIWNFFMIFSYGLWIQSRVNDMNFRISSFLTIVFGITNIREGLFYEHKLVKNIEEKQPEKSIPKGIKMLLPYNLQKANKVLRLKADDHYLYVQTELGSEHIRLRLRDAIEMLESTIGAQTHRSHWVNFSFVKEVKNNSIILEDGTTIPLSKSYQKFFL
jgi:hypothetical protein